MKLFSRARSVAISLLGIILGTTAVAGISFAGQIKARLDIGYSGSRVNKAEVITGKRELTQEYALEYLTSLGYFWDFQGNLKASLGNSAATGSNDTKTMSSSLNLRLTADRVGLNAAWDGSHNSTEKSLSVSELDTYTSSLAFSVRTTPVYLPTLTVTYDSKHDLVVQMIDRVSNKLTLEMAYNYKDLQSKFKYSNSLSENTLPTDITSHDVNWEGSMSFGRKITKSLDLQLEYNINESFGEDYDGDVFVIEDKNYKHNARGSAKWNYLFLPSYAVGLNYDVRYEEDLLKQAYDYKMGQSISLDANKDLLDSVVLSLSYSSANDKVYAVGGDEDLESVKTKLTGNFRVKPFSWIDIDAKVNREISYQEKANSGLSVLTKETNRYEANAMTRKEGFMQTTFSHSLEEEFENSQIKSSGRKMKLSMGITPFEGVSVDPQVSIDVTKTYDLVGDDSHLSAWTRNWNGQLHFSFEKSWLEIFAFRAEHTFSYQYRQELDRVLNVTESTDYSEQSSLTFKITDIIRGLSTALELQRSASDVKDDEEPLIADRTLNLRAEYEWSDYLTWSATYKFDDKGDAVDYLQFSTSITWKMDFYSVIGEYEYEKLFAEETDITAKFKLGFKMSF